MFAFPRLVLLMVVIAAVWIGYRWLNGLVHELPRRRPAPGNSAIRAEDLAPCEICGTYVAARASSCGRSDCPRAR